MFRKCIGALTIAILIAVASHAEAQQVYRGNNFYYVVPFRHPVVVPIRTFPTYYQSYRPGYYSYPVYGRTIITRTRRFDGRAPTGGSHYFGNPHASQYFGNPHASQYFGN